MYNLLGKDNNNHRTLASPIIKITHFCNYWILIRQNDTWSLYFGKVNLYETDTHYLVTLKRWRRWRNENEKKIPRSTECFLISSKYRNGRQSTLLRNGVLYRPTEYAMLQDGILSRPTEYHLHLRKYYDGRQSTSAFCASIVTADRVRGAIEKSTLTADRVFPQFAKKSWRPIEYLL